MRRKILMVMLGFGVVAGFAAGFARLSHAGWDPHGRGRWGHHAELERRVADACAVAALRVYDKQQPPRPQP